MVRSVRYFHFEIEKSSLIEEKNAIIPIGSRLISTGYFGPLLVFFNSIDSRPIATKHLPNDTACIAN